MNVDSAVSIVLMLAVGLGLLVSPSFLPGWLPPILSYLATAAGVAVLLLAIACAGHDLFTHKE